MNRLLATSLCVMLMAVALASLGAAETGTPVPAATPFTCPVTQPNGNEPPPDANVAGRGQGNYGNDILWTPIWFWGDGVVDPSTFDGGRVMPDGVIPDLKWPWYRYVPGRLTIDGHRLDAPAPPLTAHISDGYGDQGFQVSGITFPTDGCWEVTGRVDDAGSLTFVVQVVYPEGVTPIATPAPQSSPVA